jgi:hypothetical protein
MDSNPAAVPLSATCTVQYTTVSFRHCTIISYCHNTDQSQQQALFHSQVQALYHVQPTVGIVIQSTTGTVSQSATGTVFQSVADNVSQLAVLCAADECRHCNQTVAANVNEIDSRQSKPRSSICCTVRSNKYRNNICT